MALSTALMLAPTAIKLGNRAFGGGSKPSAYEKELGSMADIFGADAKGPITDNRMFTSGKTMLDERDRDNRRAINNSSAITGSTDEAKLANMDNSNKSYNQGLNQLLEMASRFRDQSRNRYMNVLGAKEGARRSRQSEYNQNFDGIVDGIGQATKAFAMTDLFDPGGSRGGAGSWGDGSNKLLNPGGFGGGTAAQMFR